MPLYKHACQEPVVGHIIHTSYTHYILPIKAYPYLLSLITLLIAYRYHHHQS